MTSNRAGNIFPFLYPSHLHRKNRYKGQFRVMDYMALSCCVKSVLLARASVKTNLLQSFVHPKLILAAAVFPRLLECARPRAQQRGKAGRHRFGQSASPFVHCCGRGRPHSAMHLGGGSVILLQRLHAVTALFYRGDAAGGGFGAAQRRHDWRVGVNGGGADFHFIGAR